MLRVTITALDPTNVVASVWIIPLVHKITNAMTCEWAIPQIMQVKQKKIGVSTLNAKLAEHIDKIDTDLVRGP